MHVRSIFLQGLLLKNNDAIKNSFYPGQIFFLRWDNYCNKYQISKLQGAINFILNTRKIKKIVVGFTV